MDDLPDSMEFLMQGHFTQAADDVWDVGLAWSSITDYLFGCDECWSGIADTWHRTIDDAMDHAECEYEGVAAT
jgi:hypothetical protein